MFNTVRGQSSGSSIGRVKEKDFFLTKGDGLALPAMPLVIGNTVQWAKKNIWRFRRFPCRLLRLLERIGVKSLFAVVGIGGKIILDYVIRRLDALSAGLKWIEGLNFR